MPCIAFCNSDSSLKNVDIAIPGNNAGKEAIGCLYWMLAREVLRLRGTISRSQPWNVMVDMFFQRTVEEAAEKEQAAAARADEPASWEVEGPSGSAMDAAWEANQTGAPGETGSEWASGAAGGEWASDAPAAAPTSWN